MYFLSVKTSIVTQIGNDLYCKTFKTEFFTLPKLGAKFQTF